MQDLNSLISTIAINGISGAFTFSNYIPNDNSWEQYFCPEILSKIKNEISQIKEDIFNRCKITAYDVSISPDNKCAVVSLQFNESGFKNSQSFYKEYDGKCLLVNIGQWKIYNFIKNQTEFKLNILTRIAKHKDNKLTLAMIVNNEENEYFKKGLNLAKEYINSAVIIDTGSKDGTVNLIKSILQKDLILIEKNDFQNELELKKFQWEQIVNSGPDWILFLEPGEYFEDKFKKHVKKILDIQNFDRYLFKKNSIYKTLLTRYQPNFNYVLNEHLGNVISNFEILPGLKVDINYF